MKRNIIKRINKEIFDFKLTTLFKRREISLSSKFRNAYRSVVAPVGFVIPRNI